VSVPDGYKVTEVGVIPEDWEVSRIADVAGITTGSRNTQDRVSDGRYPFFVRSQTIERIDSYSFDGEAVLTAGDGVGTGKIFHYINGKFDCHQRVYRMSHFNGVNGAYFFKVFSERFYDRIMSMTAKSSVDSVRREMIADMMIPLPPLPEQEAIAAALSEMDDAIAAHEAVIAKKRALKQATMQALLSGTRRLPGFSEEWEEKRLGDAAVLKARIGWQGLTTGEYLEAGDFYLVTGTDFKDGYVDWENCCFVDEWRYRQDKNIQLKQRDVLVTKDGTLGKVALVSSLPGRATLNSGVFVVRPREESFVPEFFYFVLRSKVFAEFLDQLSAGSTITHLYQKDFVNFKFQAPPALKEQVAIATILADMDVELAELKARHAKLHDLKVGMMQQLLTGKIRLV
jgi:type I restriction enzyme, S subunit